MKKSIALVLKVLLITALFINEAFAQQCSENTSVNGNAGTGFSNGQIGQSFTACKSGRLASVSVTAGSASTGFNYVVAEIFSGDGYGGTKLATTGQIHVKANRTTTWSLTSYNIEVVEGQKYTARFTTQSGTPMMAYGTYTNTAVDYYSRGRIYGAANSHNDMFFSAAIDIINNTLTPLDQATDVSRISDIEMSFSRSMSALIGDVELVDVTAGTSEIFPVANLILDGGLVTIPNSTTLKANTQYEVLVPSGALESTDGLAFDGFSTGEWTFTTTPDRVPTISSSAGQFTNLSPIPFAIEFTETVTGFDDNDLTITNGTASNFVGSGTSYTVDITPVTEGIVKVETLADVTVEGNEVAADSLMYDITSPTVTLTSDESGTTTRSPFELTVQFSEPVTGFDAEFLDFENAEFTSAQTINDSTFLVSISSQNDGTMTVDVPTASASDLAGNMSIASSQFSLDYQSDLNDGLISHFPLNGVKFDINNINEDLIEFSGAPELSEDHHGQMDGGYNFASKILYGQSFDNSPLENGFSISTWIRPTSEMGAISDKRVIYDHSTSSTLYYEANALRLDLNGTTDQYVYPIVLPANTWVHLVVSVTQNGKVYLYVDNIQHDLGAGPSSLTEISNFLVMGSTASVSSLLSGDMDDFRYYGRAIHSVEASALYNEAEYLLETDTMEICENDSFVTPAGDELTEDGNYGYVNPSEDATPDSFIALILNTITAPDVVATADNLIVCEGNEVTLTGQGADTYVWDNGVVDGVAFIPTTTTTYTVTGTSANGCENMSEVTIQVAPRDFDDEALSTTAPAFCPDGSAFSATISTASSSIGVDYYLRNSPDNTVLDGPVAGTGSSLDFNAGTLTASSTFNVFAEQPSTATNAALDFDGSNDKVATTYVPSATIALTIEGWVMPRSTNYDRIIGNYNGTGFSAGDIVVDTYNASANNGKALRFLVSGSGSAHVNYSVPNVLTLNAWNHIAITFDNGLVKIYVDGTEVGSTTFALTSLRPTTAPLQIGEDIGGTNAEYFNGKMDEIRIWNSVRTAAELKANKDITLTGTETDLSAYFKFDDNTGTTAIDEVSSANGTLTNMDENTDWVTGADIASLDYFSCSFQMTQEITIGDQTAPTVILQDIAFSLDESGTISLIASDFDNGSTDNCSALADLTFTLDQSSFGCDDIGEQAVNVTVTDQAGNQTSAVANVTIAPYINDEIVTIADETLCPGETTVSIVSSQAGVNYYLRNSSDDAVIEGPIEGTGSALDFNTGVLTQSATFNVLAELQPVPSGLELLGSNQAVIALEDVDFQYQNGYTVEAMINLDAPGAAGSRPIVSYGTATSSDIEIYVQGTTNKLLVLHGRTTSAALTYFIYPSPTFGDWTHIAVTYDGATNTVNVYYDGVAQTRETAINPNGLITKRVGAALAIGASRIFSGTNNSFVGMMDEVRIWDRKRTETEIRDNGSSCLEGNESGLVAYFNFEEGTGTTVTDLAGGNNGTLITSDSNANWVAGASIACAGGTCQFEMTTEVSITVEDNVLPVAIAKNITIQLESDGNAMISASDIDNGSSDNCTLSESLMRSIDQTVFDQTMIGENTVTLTIEDLAGNTATATAVVTITSEIEDRAVTTVSNSICPESEAIITLNNSQPGLNYTLRDENNATVSGPVLGSGLDIDFNAGTLAAAKTFNVLAEVRLVDEEAFNQAGIGYVSVPASSSLQLSNNWTIEAWVYASDARSLYIVETYDANGGFVLRTNNSGVLQAFAMFSSSSSSSVTGNTSLTNGEWSHVAATFNETTDELKVYVNGVLDNTNSSATVDQRGSQVPVKLGARGDDNNISRAHIQDEVRIWNIERTAQEIDDHKSLALSGYETGLVAYYDFNEVAISGTSTIEDKSSNNNNGTTVGSYTQSNIVTGALPSQTESYGIQMSITQTITPEDVTPPTVITQNITKILSGSATVTITPADINNGSSDNCTAVGDLTYSLNITSFDINNLGENTVTLSVTDDNGNLATATAIVTVSDKTPQTITFDAIADKVFGGANFELAASSDSQLPIVFSVLSGGVTISGTTATITGAGPATIKASQAGDDTFAASEVDRTFNIAKADQILTIDEIADQVSTASPITINASANSGLSLTYLVTGPATISGNVITLDGTVGTVTVTVSQAGSANYNTISQSISFEVVNKEVQTVSFIGVADKVFGGADFAIDASVNSGLSVHFAVISGGLTIIQSALGLGGGGSATFAITGAGSGVIQASNDGNDTYAPLLETITINVAKADQILTVDAINSKSAAAQPITVNASVDTGLALDYSVTGPATNSGSLITLDGTVGTVEVTVSQAGNDNYNMVSATTSFEVVAKQSQTISFTDVPDLIYGAADQTLSATASSNLGVSFSLISGPAVLTGSTLAITGSGTVVVEASQAGDDDFLEASEQQTFTVAKASLTVTAADQTISFGDALPNLTFSYSGFVNGESSADLIAEPTISTDASATSDAGTYSITLAGGGAANYAITLVGGTLTINTLDQIISIDPIGDKEPNEVAFDVIASVDSGLDLAYAVTGPATISGTTITLDGSEGIVTVTVSQAGDVNHNTASESITFNVAAPLGIDESLSGLIKIYPNPVANYIVVDTEKLVDLKFFGLNGQLVKEVTQVKGKVDVSAMKVGIYLMEVSTGNETLRLRIHKMK